MNNDQRQNSQFTVAAPRIFVLVALFIGGLGHALGPVASLLELNKLKEATPLCRQIEVLSSFAQEEVAACAWVYYRTGRLDAADALKEKLKARSSIEHQLLSAFGYMKRKKWDQAKGILDLVEKTHQGTSIALTAQQLQAEMYEMRGQLPIAAFIYKQIIGDDPRRARAHWGLARHYLNRGEQQRALTHLTETAKLWPSHISSRYNMGVLYMNQSDFRKAGEWLAECYKLDRGDPGVLEQLGVLFEKKGRLADAVKYWQRAFDIDKKSVLAKSKLKKFYGKLIEQAIAENRWESASKYLESAERVSGKTDRVSMFCWRGIILSNTAASVTVVSARKTEFAKAAGELKNCLAEQPDNIWAMRQLGVSYVNLNLLKEAQAFFLKATKREPKEGLNWAWLGFVQAKLGQVCESVASYRQSVPLLSDSEDISKAVRQISSIQQKAEGRCK